MVAKSLRDMVGATGIEPVTPTMSTLGPSCNHLENQASAEGGTLAL